MGKYMFLFREAQDTAIDAASAEQWQADMVKWKHWMDDLVAKGHLMGGDPLQTSGKVVSGKAMKVTDGPFAEGKEIVGGYLIVQAADIDAAAELAKGCPILPNGGRVEVRPLEVGVEM